MLQSLRASGNNESQLETIPTAVIVEAGILVSILRYMPVSTSQFRCLG